MKKLISLALAAILFTAALDGCASVEPKRAIDVNITLTSSDAADAAAWLCARLGAIPGKLVIGTDASAYGIDLSAREADGYIIRDIGGETLIFARNGNGLDRGARRYAKAVEAGESAIDVTYHEGYRVKRLTVAGNDISEYAIVRSDDASECMIFACTELADHIKLSCGAQLPQFTESGYAAAESKPAHRIVFTEGNKALGDEGYTICVDDAGDLHIDGGVWRGCMYGVYDLLEDDIGWRFVGWDYIPKDKCKFLYEAEHIDLTSAINRTEIPAIPIRGGVGDVINRNDNFTLGIAEYGGYGFAIRSCHGMQNDHSIIFSGEYEGLYPGYTTGGVQPCFTREDIIEAVEHYAVEFVRTRLEAGQQIGKEIHCVDIAQCDTPSTAFCKCKRCTKVFHEEGSNAGAYLRMANRVCALLDEKYRDGEKRVYCSCLAYCGTDICPKITRPADNLYVAFCFYVGEGYGACGNHCLSGEDCEPTGITNKIPAERFEGWLKVTDPKMIQIWYYPLNAYNICYNAPVYTTILKNIQYLASKGIGNFHLCSGWVSNGNVNDMLSRYLASHFAWDPTYTEEEALELMREWFNNVYGEAGDLLFELTMLSEHAGDLAGCWCSFANWTNDRVDYGFIAKYGDEILETCKKCVALADDKESEELIERYTAGFMYLVLISRYDELYINGDQTERAALTEEYRAVWERFRKYNLATFTDLNNYGHVPEIFDPDVDPRLWMDYEFLNFSSID